MGNNLACISQPTAESFRASTVPSVPTQTYPGSFNDIRNGAICLDYCTTEYAGARYLYDAGGALSGAECYCFSNELGPTDIVDADNSDGTCVPGDVKYIKRSTTFANLICTDIPADTTGTTLVSTIPDCFFQCRNSEGAYITYTGGDSSSFSCQCGPWLLQTEEQKNCAPGIAYSFQHTNYPQSSGLARRSLRERKAEAVRRRRLGKGGDMEYCPAGLSACSISAKANSGYEVSYTCGQWPIAKCIDTSSELESCGGCNYGIYLGPGLPALQSSSKDCTAMPGTPLGGSTCVNGRCIAMACEAGFYLEEGACLAQMD